MSDTIVRILLVWGLILFGLRGVLVYLPSLDGWPIFDWVLLISLTVAGLIILYQLIAKLKKSTN